MFAYYRAVNDYAGMKYHAITQDIGIGISTLNRLRGKIPKNVDVKHVLSDIMYIIYTYNDYVSMKELYRYLQSLELSPTSVEAFFDRFMGFKLDKEAPLLHETLAQMDEVMV